MDNLTKIIQDTGVRKGDTVYVHADLRCFGLTRNSDGQVVLRIAAETLFDAIMDVIGDSGMIVVPSYSYSWSRGEVYSLKNSPGTMGIFSEYVRKKTGSERSRHPILSLAAFGKRAKWLVGDCGDGVYGKRTPYSRLCELNSMLLLVGVPFCSIKDHVEALIQVPYRYKKYFQGFIEIEGKKQRTICSHFVRYRYGDQTVELGSFLKKMPAKKLSSITRVAVGNRAIHAIRAQNAVKILKELLLKNPYHFVTKAFCDHKVFEILMQLNGYTSAADHWKLELHAEQQEDGEIWNWRLINPSQVVLDTVGWKGIAPPSSLSLCVGGSKDGSEVSLETALSMHCEEVDDTFVLQFLSTLGQSSTARLKF